MNKICTCCGEEKPLSEFYPNYNYRSGYQTQCKDCMRKKAREWKLNNNYSEKKRKIRTSHLDIRRICNRCGEEKHISEFYKNPRGKYGYAGICIECTIQRQKITNKKIVKKPKVKEIIRACGLDEWKHSYRQVLPDNKVYPQGFKYLDIKLKSC